MKTLTTSILLIVLTVSCHAESPYSGEQTRDIKALSQSDIEGYLSGKGMGFAKAAELNNYPGPKHVLDLAEKLQLNPTQSKQTQALYADMQHQASTLGKQLVYHERQLDRLYANGKIDEASLNSLLVEIGQLQTSIRFTHLRTHLHQKKLLNVTQTDLYRQLRGYDDSTGQNHSHSH